MLFEPIYIPRALNTGTCLRQGYLFYPAGLHRNHVLATANTGRIGRGFGKSAGEWTCFLFDIGVTKIHLSPSPRNKQRKQPTKQQQEQQTADLSFPFLSGHPSP